MIGRQAASRRERLRFQKSDGRGDRAFASADIQVALPNHEYFPALLSQATSVIPISLLIALELGEPIFGS